MAERCLQVTVLEPNERNSSSGAAFRDRPRPARPRDPTRDRGQATERDQPADDRRGRLLAVWWSRHGDQRFPVSRILTSSSLRKTIPTTR